MFRAMIHKIISPYYADEQMPVYSLAESGFELSHLSDEGPNEGLTPSEYCSQTKFDHPQVVFQRKLIAVGPVVCLPYPEF